MIIYNDKPNKFNFPKFNLFTTIFFLVFAWIFIPAFIVEPMLYFSNIDYVTVKVKSKERTCYSGKSGSCKYLIYTDTEVFEDTDSWIDGKYNSADIYNQLDAGKICNIKVRGKRVPYFSLFRNVVQVRYCFEQ